MAAASTSSQSLPSSELFPVPLEPRIRRLESIDMVRGFLMVVMALDHTRDYFSNIEVNPTDPHHSWPLLFFTRWITHLCAPGFVALAGTSVYLQRQRGKTPGELQRLLITRGLWLMFLEVTVISFGWSFIFAPFFQVIFAVGISMVGLGLIIRLPTRAIGGLGAAIVCLHNLLDPIKAGTLGDFRDGWIFLHQMGMLTANGHPVGFVAYPVLAWFGIICLGYAFGPIAAAAPEIRRRRSLILSAWLLTTFVVLRVFHLYGDSNPMEKLATPSQTTMSLLNVTKYPPSLDYVLATFGVLLLIYAAFDLAASRNWIAPARRVLETFGRVPFFFYVPHIYLLHAAALLTTIAMHAPTKFYLGLGVIIGGARPIGFSLGVVYLIWIAVVAVLYPACVWFSGVKARRRDWWLSYL